MSESNIADHPPGPKTAVRAGAVRDPFSLILGERDRAAVKDQGAAVRRDLANEIRAQAPVRPARRKRGR